MKRLSRLTTVAVGAALFGAITVGYALAQMGPGGMMGGGPPHGQGQQAGPPMGPGMMGPGGMMGGGMMGARATNDRPWITVILDHREELELSAEQVWRLFNLRDGFAREARKKTEALEKL